MKILIIYKFKRGDGKLNFLKLKSNLSIYLLKKTHILIQKTTNTLKMFDEDEAQPFLPY